MVCQSFGQEIWQEIQQKAGLAIETFISMEGYPDDVTHRLVKAASEVLGLSASEVMQAFGEYWVQYTAQEGYGEMMDMSGETLPEFLENLDQLHARVGLIFPHLQPPSFDCTDQTEDAMNLHYRSQRAGLTSMVVGLIKGLGSRFNTEVKVTLVESREQGANHDEFLIQYKPDSMP